MCYQVSPLLPLLCGLGAALGFTPRHATPPVRTIKIRAEVRPCTCVKPRLRAREEDAARPHRQSSGIVDLYTNGGARAGASLGLVSCVVFAFGASQGTNPEEGSSELVGAQAVSGLTKDVKPVFTVEDIHKILPHRYTHVPP